MKQAPKAVIFDLWETLGTKNVGVSNSLRERFCIEKTPDFLRKYEEAVQLDAWETEQAMAENFLRSFSLSSKSENVDFITNLFAEAIQKATLYPGMLDLLNKLRSSNYKLGLLSNTTVFEAIVPKNWGIDSFLDAEVYSWQLHSLKPAPENFATVCSRLEVLPKEAIFIDDGEKNVEGARNFGMQGQIFTGVKELDETLNRLKS